MNRKSFLLLLAVLFTATLGSAQTGGTASIAGVVRDNGGDALPGVTVTITRAGDAAAPSVVVTELDGAFRVAALRPGGYSVQAALDGFQPVSSDVKLVTGQKLDVVLKMVPAFSETVDVVAEAAKTGEVAILESRRQAPVVSDSISAEEIRKTPDSSAAGVVERLTGVTLIGEKYVFVRGLGERYSGTTINGATLPTTETEKRVVPLDLFPAKLLETVNVAKTYTPDKPGDFGSGVVEMTTTQFPPSATFKLTLGSGWQSGATGGDFRRYAGGLDVWGGGGQAMPPTIPASFIKRRSILDPSGFTPQELEAFGESLIGDWSGRGGSAPPARDFSLTYGNTVGPVGLVFSAVSNHKYDTIDEELRFFGADLGGALVPRNDYALTTSRESANTGLIGNVSLRINDTNRVFLNSVLTRDATSEQRFQEGLNTNSGGNIRDYRVRYQIEEILSTRLRGEHNLGGPGMGSLLEWSLAHSSATNGQDLRENLYRELDPGVFALNTGAAEAGNVNFFDLEDEIRQGGVSYSVFYATPNGTRSGTLKAGVDRIERTRDFAARRFRFNLGSLGGLDLTRSPEEIFTPANIGPSGFELREVTGVNDAYDAEHTIDAAYLMADSTFGRWRFIGGARYEDSTQSVTTFNPFDVGNLVRSQNDARDVLPSLNAVYQLSQRTNFRLAYGRSVNRPEFRELSPFAFVEVAGGRSLIGNPELVQATIDGVDARWELFPRAGEVMAVSAFYKRIDKPIERVVQPTTELRTSFVNADSATLYGVELELRRSLFGPWSINANYAYIESDVRVGEQQLSVVTNLERPLEGQSDQVANLALQYFEPRLGTMFRLLGSYTGDRLTDVGAYGLPDIYEASFLSVDAVVSQRIAFLNGIEVKLAATNLLDATREFTQGGAVQRKYQPGRTVSLSLSYSPF